MSKAKTKIEEQEQNMNSLFDFEDDMDSATDSEIAAQAQRKIIKVQMDKFQKAQYLSYAQEVIEDRAFPSLKDGYKPVQRRILYTMKDLGCLHNTPFKKSARVVGEVMGKLHPHGDSSIYQGMVNMAVDFKQRVPVITPQGNFGSIDGDSPAAMRYTEARLSEIATYGLFDDLDKNVVDFVPNYDNSETEPVALPIRFPQLLVNGVEGIAVGAATSCLPHNFNEVIDATLAYQENPNITTDEIMAIMPAPDFPTGGIVYQLEGYRKAIETGSGSVKCRATFKIEENKLNTRSKKLKNILVIDSIPFQVNKEKMIGEMEALISSDEMLDSWIERVRDESEKSSIRIAVYLYNEGNELGELIFNIFCNRLSNYFAPSFSYNINATDTGVSTEKYRQVNFKDIFKAFLDFRYEINVRRSKFIIAKTEKEIHSLKGVMAVLESENTLNETIQLIKTHKNSKEANAALCQRFNLDEGQAQEILRMSLQKLTTDELDNLVKHNEKLINQLNDLNDFIVNDDRIQKAIRDDLIEFKEKYGKTKANQRRTQVSYEEFNVKDKTQLIKEETCVVLLTERGYVKCLPNDNVSKQNRNGKGKSTITTNENDNVKTLLTVSSHDNVLFFTSNGKVYSAKAWDLPKVDKGRHIRNMFTGIQDNVIDFISLSDSDFEQDQKQIIITTKLGKIRRTNVSAYKSAIGSRKDGLIGFKVADNDEIVSVSICKENDHLMIVTSNNTVNRFVINEDNLRTMSKSAAGLDGVKLANDEYVIDALVIPVEENQIIYKKELVDNLIPIDEETANQLQESDSSAITKIGKNIFKIDGQKEIDVLDTTLIDDNRFLLTMSENGVGKKVSLSEFKVQKRKAKGRILTKESEKSGKLIKSVIVSNEDDIIVTTNQKTIKVSVKDINEYSRSAVGVYIMDVNNDKVVSMTSVKTINDLDEQ